MKKVIHYNNFQKVIQYDKSIIQGNIWQTNDLVLYDNFLRLAYLLILKIPSKIAVARVIPCWNCLHCLHLKTA